MRVRATLAWALGMVAAIVGLGHGAAAASAQQPTSTVRTQAFSASSNQNGRGSLIDVNAPVAVAFASKSSAKQHRSVPLGLVASNWTLDRPTAVLAEPVAGYDAPPSTSGTAANVRAPPGALRA